ncbi:MAG: Asp-tRNA(Asn)/Glu-tRNA(Gln) amidotransferase subunit GatC [Alphaproteobacteria bacterium]|nr:Asp-tRNA(Asn)/Glu-tRNA(Gln) amidotransferase subunit GatC [Alphaproteobacteria bacterium]
MYFTKEKIKKNAKLVRIGMPDELAEKMIPELENVIEWIEGLDDVNVDGVEPLISVNEHALPKRVDTIKMENTRDEVLTNAPSPNEDGEFFTVPKIIE